MDGNRELLISVQINGKIDQIDEGFDTRPDAKDQV